MVVTLYINSKYFYPCNTLLYGERGDARDKETENVGYETKFVSFV